MTRKEKCDIIRFNVTLIKSNATSANLRFDKLLEIADLLNMDFELKAVFVRDAMKLKEDGEMHKWDDGFRRILEGLNLFEEIIELNVWQR